MAHKRLAVFVKNVHRGPFSFLMGALSLALTHTVKHHRNHLCKPWAETFRIRTKMTDVGPILGQLRCHVWPEISAKLVTKCTGNLTRNWNNVVPEVRPRSPEVAHQALAPCVARKWSGPTSVQFGPASVNFGPVSVRLGSGFGPVSVRFRSGFGAAVSTRPGGYTSAQFRSTSVQFRSGIGPVSVRLWPTSVRLCRKYG